MVVVSELKAIENAIFRGEFYYDKCDLLKFLEKYFNEDVWFSNNTIDKLNSLINNEQKNFAHNILLKRDISEIQKYFDEKNTNFDINFWKTKLEEIKEKITEFIGLEFNIKEMHFVDEFDSEFKTLELKGASAMTVFDTQKKAGIYFLNKRIDSTQTAIHIIHEQIHTCFSQNRTKDSNFIEWFEESFTIFLSLKIYFELTNDLKTLDAYSIRSLIFSKIKPDFDISKRYYELVKIFTKLYFYDGEDFIKKLIKLYSENKREELNKYLDLASKNNLEIKYLPKTDFEKYLWNFNLKIEGQKLAPMEYLIIEKLIDKELSLEDISKEVLAPSNIVQGALNSLFGKGFCYMNEKKLFFLDIRKKDYFELNLIKALFPLN